MITAQDIREKSFEKSKFSGYDMASVDDFLEELADDITASQKENAVLKSKMKVLVDKIEEYRANEDALKMAIISAQKLAGQIEADSRKRATAMLADADRQVKARVGSIEEETAKQERRLADAKAATSMFIDGMRAMCKAQLKNLDAISSGILTQPEPVRPAEKAGIDETVRTIEDNVSRAQAGDDAQMQIEFPSVNEDKPQNPKDFNNTQPFSF